MAGLRAARALDRLNAYNPPRRLPHVSLGWLLAFNALVSFSVAFWTVRSIPASAFESMYLEVTALLVWFCSFMMALVLFFVLRPTLGWILFFSPLTHTLERMGLVFMPDPWLLTGLNSYLEEDEDPRAARVVKPHLARIMRAAPDTRLSHAGALHAYRAAQALRKQYAHEELLQKIAEEEKDRREKEAASPLGMLAAQAQRAQTLDGMVNQDVSRPADDKPQL